MQEYSIMNDNQPISTTYPITLQDLFTVAQQNVSGVDFIGCSDQEIDQLAEAQQVKYLPDVYRHLMSRAGKAGISYIYQDYDGTYETVLILKEFVREDIQDCELDLQYPDDAFLFAFYTEKYLMFRTYDCNPDPAVYIFSHETGHWHKAFDSFSEFLWTRYLFFTRRSDEKRSWLPILPFLSPCTFDLVLDEFVPYQRKSVVIPPFEEVIQTFLSRFVPESLGCTEAEIERVMHLKAVDWLPETYRRLLELCGRVGIEMLLLDANYAKIPKSVRYYQWKKGLKPRTAEPQWRPDDLVVWGGHLRLGFSYGFRVGDHNPDPPVYMVQRRFMFHAADSLSEFIFQRIAPELFDTFARRGWGRPFYYDSQSDALLPVTKEFVLALV
jgi:hypothetical protein